MLCISHMLCLFFLTEAVENELNPSGNCVFMIVSQILFLMHLRKCTGVLK